MNIEADQPGLGRKYERNWLKKSNLTLTKKEETTDQWTDKDQWLCNNENYDWRWKELFEGKWTKNTVAVDKLKEGRAMKEEGKWMTKKEN